MTFISVRKLTPNIGKFDLAAQRARALGEIYTRNGARVRISRVVAGDDAGQIHFYAVVDDGKSLAQVFEKVQADPEFTRLREERGRNPAGSVAGPEVYRIVHGQPQLDYPVILQRVYTTSRDKRDDALALLPEVDALAQRHDIKVLAAIPTFASNMSETVVAYYYRSPAHLGAALDNVGAQAEFQSLVKRAAAFGTLTRSFVVMSM